MEWINQSEFVTDAIYTTCKFVFNTLINSSNLEDLFTSNKLLFNLRVDSLFLLLGGREEKKYFNILLIIKSG